MDKPTIELILPDSTAKVVLYQYISSGQFKELQKVFMKNIKLDMSKETDSEDFVKESMKDIPAEIMLDQEEILHNFLIKEVFDKEGNAIQDIKGFVFDLTINDGQVLSNKLLEIEKNSNHTEISKKK